MNPTDESEEQKLNYLAIEFLEILDNKNPTQQQIDLMENILSHTTIQCRFSLHPQLTKPELMTLYLVAHGRTSQESAHILKINFDMIENHRTQIKQKLNCKTMAHAVFKGMQYGYLPVNIKPKIE